MLAYPAIDPVAFSVGPAHVHWYGITFLIGFAAAWHLGRRRAARLGSGWTPADVDDLMFFGMLGAILGGRIGWVLFYGTEEVLQDPWRALRIWEGGMSFHGGFLGVLIAAAVFAARRCRSVAAVFDFLAPLPGIGIFAVRIGNFINGELWGKPTEVPWGFVVDPGRLYRSQADVALEYCKRFNLSPCVLHVHASQLYEGMLEGLLGFAIVWIYTSRPRLRLAPSGLFLLCYGPARFALEFVRVPDENRGYLWLSWVTMGQILSTPMIIAGLILIVTAYTRRATPIRAA
jgi:phosphatidylglycerol:prolipoprotein diacylglycerol transferase